MNNKLPLRYFVITSVILGTGLLYISDFFTTDDRVLSKTEAYVDGATPTDIAEWEMY